MSELVVLISPRGLSFNLVVPLLNYIGVIINVKTGTINSAMGVAF